MKLRTGRVYDPRRPADGLRVLVMRLWPRGVRRDQIDLWLKELGAPLPALKAWKARTISWSQFRRRYLLGLEKPSAGGQLARLKSAAARRRVTVLCACADEKRCHRSLLLEALSPRSRRSKRRVSQPGRQAAPVPRR